MFPKTLAQSCSDPEVRKVQKIYPSLKTGILWSKPQHSFTLCFLCDFDFVADDSHYQNKPAVFTITPRLGWRERRETRRGRRREKKNRERGSTGRRKTERERGRKTRRWKSRMTKETCPKK